MHMCLLPVSGTRVTLLFDLYKEDWYEKDEHFMCFTNHSPEVKTRVHQSPSDENVVSLLRGVNSLLGSGNHAVAICLGHKYPRHQTTDGPSFLKGGDRAIYDSLSDYFELEIAPIVIQSECAYDYHNTCSISAGRMFESAETSPEIEKRTILIIHSQLAGWCLLHEIAFIEHTGNESQNAEMIYRTTAVIITRKKGTATAAGTAAGTDGDDATTAG
jgi:hypothetical protein